jgi:hypothetical protein
MKLGYIGFILGILLGVGQLSLAAETAAPEEATSVKGESPALENAETAASVKAESYTASPLILQGIPEQAVFVGRQGYIHPFLSVQGLYTDNYFKAQNNKKDDWTTIISPGIWFALPASRQLLVNVTTLTSAPGGIEVTRFRTKSERRFQGYVLYRADIYRQQRFTDEDRVNQRAEGLFAVNLRGGLSAEIVDIFEHSNEPFGSTGSTTGELAKFDSNFFNLPITYSVGPRLSLEGAYTNYYLNYSTESDKFRNRDDNGLSATASYRILPKTSILAVYEYVHVNYDQNVLDDSEVQRFYGGFRYEATAKTRGIILLGYGLKNFTGHNELNDFIAEGRIEHRFTPKTSVYLRGSRMLVETDVSGTLAMLSNRVQIGYRQLITSKLRGTADLFYALEDYKGSGPAAQREDNYYGARIALGYDFRRWLNLGVGYIYAQRDSNFSGESYESNSLYLNITAAL